MSVVKMASALLVAMVTMTLLVCVCQATSEPVVLCGDGGWIRIWQVCDGTADCANGHDETNCMDHVCQASYQFKCQNTGVCRNIRDLCNGVNDCGDNSDEVACQDVLNSVGKSYSDEGDEMFAAKRVIHHRRPRPRPHV